MFSGLKDTPEKYYAHKTLKSQQKDHSAVYKMYRTLKIYHSNTIQGTQNCGR